VTPVEEKKTEKADEFLRNFFIKFAMNATLESFQQEWYELKAKGMIDSKTLPQIPEVYRKNAELSDRLAVIQEELDEARVVAEKARSTYDKLLKQKEFQKINHRRVQQEKSKLSQDASKNKSKQDSLSKELADLTAQYEAAVKEKMLMKLEKERLVAKVDSLQISLNQLTEKTEPSPSKVLNEAPKTEPKQKMVGGLKVTGQPTPISMKDKPNPYASEVFEPVNHSLSNVKSQKGHLMGVSSLAYNPKRDILATGSDDSTWKLWSVPNGDLIMCGEGHIDWIGGLDFHPLGSLLATASGDGTVKIWDFAKACCAHTFTEHGQPVWKVAFHNTGDFLLSCSMDHTVKMWDMNTLKSRYTFRGHVDSVNSIQFLPYS
jgi:hypothetical protein